MTALSRSRELESTVAMQYKREIDSRFHRSTNPVEHNMNDHR